MRRLQFITILALVSLGWASVTRAQVNPAVYQSAMVTYKQRQAQFDRDRQLYQTGAGTDFTTVLASANSAYQARSDAAIKYATYLRSLVDTYIVDDTVKADLQAKLDANLRDIQAAPTSFANLSSWSQADTSNTKALADFHETAYQCFAQIYYLELKGIIDQYAALYDTQSTRILAETSGNIDRQTKTDVLNETGRSLANLQAQVIAAKPDLNFINSAASYNQLKAKLDAILATAEKSLETYARLE